MVDYPNLLILAWHNGSDGLKQPVQIFGPGDRGTLPPIFDEDNRDPIPEVFNPESPTPGLVESSQRLLQGYALDINDRMRDNAKQDLREIFEFHDIELPGTTGSDPNGDPTPAMEPKPFYRPLVRGRPRTTSAPLVSTSHTTQATRPVKRPAYSPTFPRSQSSRNSQL